MNLKSLIRKPMKRRLFLCGIGFLIVGFIMIIVKMEDYNENILYKLLPSVLTIIISVLSSLLILIINFLNPKSIKNYRNFCAYVHTPFEEDLNNQLKRNIEKIDRCILTDDWVIILYPFSIKVFNAHDIIWAYRSRVKDNISGIQLANNTYLHIHLSTRNTITIEVSISNCETLIDALFSRAKCGYFGYNHKLRKRWIYDKTNLIKDIISNEQLIVVN